MSNWFYKEKEVTSVEQLPEKSVGFVYLITNIDTNKIYVGKKSLESKTKKPLTKKEQLEWNKPGRIPKKKLVVKESNWSDYFGSSKPLQEDVKLLGKDKFKREILKVCFNKKEMSYWETYYQFKYEVLHVDSYCENIAGKWFRKDANQSAPEAHH